MKKTPFITAFLCVAATNAATAQADEREYQWLTGTDVTGGLTVTTDSTGKTQTKFNYNDRGRGPNSTTEFRVNEKGIVVSYSANGTNYYKGVIDEEFSYSSGTASYRIDGKEASKALPNPSIYMPVNATPEYRAVTVRALLADPDNRLDMVAGGEAWLTTLQTIELTSGTNTTQVTLYEIEGPEIGPQYVWLDENKDLFSISFGWFSIIRDGWAQEAQKLKDLQFTATENFAIKKSAEFANKPDDDIIISGARVLDVVTGELSDPAYVRVSGGKIAEIKGMQSNLSGHVIDGTGKILMPSLWDMHAHMRPANFFNYIAGGFLNVRDMANDPDFIAKAQAGIASGKIAGPDIYPMGFIDKRGPYAAPTGNLADTVEDALSLIDMYHGRGYEGIKLYSSIEPEWIPAMTERAHSYGMKVMGHIPSYMTAGEAIEAGYDEITHVNMALLHLIGDKSIDTRTPQRFIVPGEKSGDLDLNSDRAKALIKLMQDRNITIDPTLGIFHDMFKNVPGEPEQMAKPYFEQLPPSLRQGMIAAKTYNDGQEEIFAKSADTAGQLVKKLHEAGITILPGTDTSFPGFALISELEMYVDAGLPVMDVIQIATVKPAKHIGEGDRLGTIETGKDAYLILVDADPREDISNLRRVDTVIKGQTYYKPKEMLKAQGYKPYGEVN